MPEYVVHRIKEGHAREAVLHEREIEARTAGKADLSDEALLPLDLDVFKRQVDYHRTLSAHLEKTGRATP